MNSSYTCWVSWCCRTGKISLGSIKTVAHSLMMISIPLKNKNTKTCKHPKKKLEMVLASFHTLLSLKVKLLQHSPNYVTNTHDKFSL